MDRQAKYNQQGEQYQIASKFDPFTILKKGDQYGDARSVARQCADCTGRPYFAALD